MAAAAVTADETISESPRKPTGFFDLSLELRQMIYEELLPKGTEYRNIRIGAPWNVHAAHPQIAWEMTDWERKRRSGKAFLQIFPNPWHMPEYFFLDRNAPRVVIMFKHYDRSGENRLFQLATMRENLQKVVQYLNNNYTALPRLSVRFDDTATTLRRGDHFWCKAPSQEDEIILGDFLDTVDGSYTAPTIIEYLLSPLLFLAPGTCQHLDIKLLKGVYEATPRRMNKPIMHPGFLKFDGDYMWTFVKTMEAWVEGRITRAKPFGQIWKKWMRRVRKHQMSGMFRDKEDTLPWLTEDGGTRRNVVHVESE